MLSSKYLRKIERNQGVENSLRCLQHPLSILSIALLLINDHIFKVVSPSWLTGKLSDFVGLFFFPFIVAMGLSMLLSGYNLPLRAIGKLAFGVVAIWFFLFKTTHFVNQASVILLSKFIGYPVQLLIDPSDILALIALLPSWNLWIKTSETKNLRIGYLGLSLAVFASLATSPALPEVESVTHLMPQNSDLIAFDITNGTVAISENGGESWKGMEEIQFSEFPKAMRPLPIIVCLPDSKNECYRINGQKIVEVSNDSGKTWEISWQLPADRITFIERTNPNLELGPYDMVVTSWEYHNYVLIAAGQEGILRKEVPSGEWERIQVRNATPTSYRSMKVSDAFSIIWIELLIWFFLSIVIFVVACWIVWLLNSKTSEQQLNMVDWVFSPALSPLLGTFLTLFIEVVIGFISLTILQIIGFSDIQNGLLVFLALCMVLVLGLLPVTIYRRLNSWKLILVEHGYHLGIANRIVVTSYLSHVFVFMVGALIWLSWTFAMISRYSFALVFALLCTGLVAMFFLKKIQDLSNQHNTSWEE